MVNLSCQIAISDARISCSEIAGSRRRRTPAATTPETVSLRHRSGQSRSASLIGCGMACSDALASASVAILVRIVFNSLRSSWAEAGSFSEASERFALASGSSWRRSADDWDKDWPLSASDAAEEAPEPRGLSPMQPARPCVMSSDAPERRA